MIISRLLNAIAIGFFFAIVTGAVFHVYYHYLDTTKYYEVYSAVVTNQPRPCESAQMVITREVRADLKADVTRSLFLKSLETNYRNMRVINDVAFGVNEADDISTPQPIPCDAPPGEYIFESIIEYEYRGVDHTYIYETKPFTVKLD